MEVPPCPLGPCLHSCCWSRTASYCERDRISPFLGAQGTKRDCFASYSFCALVKHRAYMPKSSGLDTAAHCHMRVHPTGLCSSPYLHCTTEHCHTLGPKKEKHPKLENCPKHAHPSRASPPSDPTGTDRKSHLLYSLQAVTQSPAIVRHLSAFRSSTYI